MILSRFAACLSERVTGLGPGETENSHSGTDKVDGKFHREKVQYSKERASRRRLERRQA